LLAPGDDSSDDDDMTTGLDLSADLAMFADPREAAARGVWAAAEEIDTVCASTRQPSPTPTVTSDRDHAALVSSTVELAGDAVSTKTHSSPLSAHVAQSKSQYLSPADTETASLSGESCVDSTAPEPAAVRASLRPTVFEEMTHSGIDWCRYCGTTEGINWRPGPWGKRTLCNKHGCDYKGYGFASKMPRLNLRNFAEEAVEERLRPVLQTFCQVCQKDFSEHDNVLMHCDGCHRAYHQECHPEGIADECVRFDKRWYCEPTCIDNVRRKKILVELPKCRLPYMCSPRNNAHGDSAKNGTHQTTPRTTRKRKASAQRDSGSSDAPKAATSRSNKVRKSSRVTRPSKRLASDYAE
ncbi:hypothetical protein EC988_005712, partial [Linderina pennispora]